MCNNSHNQKVNRRDIKFFTKNETKRKKGSTYIVEKCKDENIVKFSKSMRQNAKKVPVI